MSKIFKFLNTIIFSLASTLFFFTFAISLPLFIREFYYWHIDLYDITTLTGVSKSDLIYSFNELMDSLMFFKTPFSEGVFPFSEDGMNHFLDCQFLFVLDYVVLIVSAVILIVYFALFTKKKVEIYHPFNMSSVLFMMLVPMILIGGLGVYALIDAEEAFIFFHKIFFPGKTNFMFNVYTDPIVKALPESFFFNCAILIASVYVFFLIVVFIYSINRRIKYGSNKVYLVSRRKTKCHL